MAINFVKKGKTVKDVSLKNGDYQHVKSGGTAVNTNLIP